MKIIYRYLWQVIPVFFFCGGVSFLLFITKNLFCDYLLIKNSILENEVLYETQGTLIPESDITAKGELIAYLMAEPDYDIEIDHVFYSSYSFNPYQFDYKKLFPFYKKTYICNEKGDILKICYSGRRGDI